MNLINRDDIGYSIVDIVTENGIEPDFVVTECEIDKMPVVDAIPVKWIEEWIETHKDKGACGYWNRWLIEDWRKENAIDNA